ncbi:beta-lactamase family protein [Clostridium sp. CX1]|uniref:serine hydrolase domain-containing protein n=1 Tax=Clostridium sp. CX1 TaxID=2978346 RepID=UPI0021C249E7|nr:serine hydrolase domain-containing protein [Clostridium sp. CX1]MCT8975269.1 beta-lactamase family protein [Clostridium sp. CX1]
MRKRLYIILMIIVFLMPLIFYPLSVNADAIIEKEAIDEFVTNYLKRNGLPGASIVIVKDGKVIYGKGYGHDSEGKALTENSLMRIGSVSKSFTAFSVLQLVDEGKVNLDNPVVKYLPELTMDDPRLQKVTVRHLLSHTSGIPNPTIVPPASTLKAGVHRLHDWKLNWQPGDKYLYSNANYWVLARLVEVISGMEFPKYLKKNIFYPLGMNDTLSAINSGDPVKGLSKGYITAYGTALPWSELEQMFAGSGGVISTAADMGKWISMHTNEGKNVNGERLLSKSLLEESYSPQPGSAKYGLGWSLSSPNIKPARISHSGALSTIQAQQDIVPSSGYAVAVMLNSFTTTLEHSYEISSGIIQLTEGQMPDTKAPTPTIIDLSLGFITLIYLILGIRGILRSGEWSNRRKQHPTWRYYLRLMPQVIPVLFIGWLFFIVPNLQNNSATIKDAFGLWPAAMLFFTVVFLIGVVVTVMRTYYRRRLSRN